MKTSGAVRPIIVMLVMAFLPAGCGTVALFGEYDIPESADVAEADWPRLADIPPAPSAGTYGEAAPDPAQGAAVARELGSHVSE